MLLYMDAHFKYKYMIISNPTHLAMMVDDNNTFIAEIMIKYSNHLLTKYLNSKYAIHCHPY